MIGRTNVGGSSNISTSRTILGAKNEIITYAGATSGTITLDANGMGTLKLPNGPYQFIGSISGYIRFITLSDNIITIHVRPIGTIYWYGVWAISPQYSYTSDPGVIDYDTYFHWNCPVNNTWHILYVLNDGVGYEIFTVKHRQNTTAYSRQGYGSSNNPNDTGEIVSSNYIKNDSTTWETTSLKYTASTGKTHRIYGYKNNGQGLFIEIQEWYLGER